MQYFIRIRDLDKDKPEQFRFVQTGVKGASFIPVGYMEKINAG